MKKLLITFLCVVMVMVFMPTMAFAAEGVASIGTTTYTTLQDALENAKDGDTISLKDGEYYGNFTVDKNVKIVGASKEGTKLILAKAPGATNNIVDVKADLTLENVTVMGPGPMNQHILINGVYVESGDLTLNNVAIKDITCRGDGAEFCGVQTGVGVYAAEGAGKIEIKNTSIERFNKCAVVSKTSKAVNIDGVTIVGAGPQAIIGQNGIQLQNTEAATIKDVKVSGLEYTADNDWIACSYAVLVFDEANVALENVEMDDIDNIAYADEETGASLKADNLTVFVDNDNYSLENIFATAPAGTTVTLKEDYVVEADGTGAHGLLIDAPAKDITFDLGGNAIVAGESFKPDTTAGNNWRANLLTVVNAEGFTVTNGTVSADGVDTVRNVLNVQDSTGVVLDNVTLNHEGACAGAPLIVNSSEVTVTGELGLVTGENSWYGINVDNKNDSASLTFAEDSDIVYTDNSGKEDMPLILVDAKEGAEPPVVENNSDNFVLDVNEDGVAANLHKHVLTHVEAKAATTEAEGNIEYWYCEGCGKYFSDEAMTKEISQADTVVAKLAAGPETPKTGDANNMMPWVVLMAVAAAGAVALKKREN